MSYSARLEHAGFHPKLIVIYSEAPSNDCSLYLNLIVPSAFILDRFQITHSHYDHKLGSASAELLRPTLSIKGERDLEKPVSSASQTKMLMRLSGSTLGAATTKGKEKKVEIPLHVRYQIPVMARRANSGERNDMLSLAIESPTLFYACESPNCVFYNLSRLLRF